MTNEESHDPTPKDGVPDASAAGKAAGAIRKARQKKAAAKSQKRRPTQPGKGGRAPHPKTSAKSTKTGASAADKKPRPQSKGARILELIRRAKGATLAEIMQATKWQAHYADVRIMPTCVGNPALRAVIACDEVGIISGV